MARPVLIIEDDADIAEILRYALEKENHETRVALTGEKGLQDSLDKQNPPSLILLDLLLPGMSGIEICKRLRREPLTRNVPIVIITATTLSNDKLNLLAIGANDIIAKPFLLSDVVAKVNLFKRID